MPPIELGSFFFLEALKDSPKVCPDNKLNFNTQFCSSYPPPNGKFGIFPNWINTYVHTISKTNSLLVIFQSFACFIYLLSLHFNFIIGFQEKSSQMSRANFLSPPKIMSFKKKRFFFGNWGFSSINSTKFANFWGKFCQKFGNIIKLKKKPWSRDGSQRLCGVSFLS